MPAPSVDQLPLSVPVFQSLLALVDRDLHGYAIIKDVHARSGGALRLTASSVYGALARLLEAGLVGESPDPDDERRRLYHLTASGRTLLRREVERMEAAVRQAQEKRLVPQSRNLRS
jgi:DNA-binding PadR family transcriptional regulator